MSFQVNVASNADWDLEIMGTPGTLQVVELYQSWSGPCKVVASTLKGLYFNFSDRPLKFYTVAIDKIKGVGLEKYVGKCEPVFMLYKDGECLETIVGLQGSIITERVTTLSAPE